MMSTAIGSDVSQIISRQGGGALSRPVSPSPLQSLFAVFTGAPKVESARGRESRKPGNVDRQSGGRALLPPARRRARTRWPREPMPGLAQAPDRSPRRCKRSGMAAPRRTVYVNGASLPGHRPSGCHCEDAHTYVFAAAHPGQGAPAPDRGQVGGEEPLDEHGRDGLILGDARRFPEGGLRRQPAQWTPAQGSQWRHVLQGGRSGVVRSPAELAPMSTPER